MTTIVVTGANRGLGLEFTLQYAVEGARVFAGTRAPDQAKELRALAGHYPDRISIHALDVTDSGSIRSLKNDIGATPIDILINNAGIFGGSHQSVADMDYAAWDSCLETNLIGPYEMVQTFLDNLRAAPGARVVTISSGLASIGGAGGGLHIYRSSKAAMNMAMRALANDLAGEGISVVIMDPGWVQTDMGGANAALTPEQSVSGMRAVIARADAAMSGKFMRWDGGETPW